MPTLLCCCCRAAANAQSDFQERKKDTIFFRLQYVSRTIANILFSRVQLKREKKNDAKTMYNKQRALAMIIMRD